MLFSLNITLLKSTLLYIDLFIPFELLYNIPSCDYATCVVSVPLPMDLGCFWLVTNPCSYLLPCAYVHALPEAICLQVELLDGRICIFSD